MQVEGHWKQNKHAMLLASYKHLEVNKSIFKKRTRTIKNRICLGHFINAK